MYEYCSACQLETDHALADIPGYTLALALVTRTTEGRYSPVVREQDRQVIDHELHLGELFTCLSAEGARCSFWDPFFQLSVDQCST